MKIGNENVGHQKTTSGEEHKEGPVLNDHLKEDVGEDEKRD